MKKQLLNIALCTIMLLAISYQAKSQNYLGLSKTEIQSRFKNKGIETTLSVRDDGMTYLWFFNENEDFKKKSKAISEIKEDLKRTNDKNNVMME
jgi:hypothetical protein